MAAVNYLTTRMLALIMPDEVLDRLATLDPRKTRAVELRFFGGLTMKESAEALNVSEGTVRRDWQFAKIWLLRGLSGEKGDGT
jgi:RNA polymerase sigma factor (sigma-70 family)